MKKSFNRKFNRYVYEIFAGDYYTTVEQNVVLTTLLGSCISVCMRDSFSKVVGINHFMLPGRISSEDLIFSEDARYGISAMEKMINSMMKRGARRNSLEAKVFGGGRVMETSLTNVAQSNADFAMSFLQMEGIPILAKDTGGQFGRKLFFFPDTYTIYVKRIHYDKTLDNAISREKRFLDWMHKHQEGGELTLFD